MALKKAAQDLFVQNSPKHFCNLKFECDGKFMTFNNFTTDLFIDHKIHRSQTLNLLPWSFPYCWTSSCNSHNISDSQDDYCEDEENIEFDWLMTNDASTDKALPEPGLLSLLYNYLFVSFPYLLVILSCPQLMSQLLRMKQP